MDKPVKNIFTIFLLLLIGIVYFLIYGIQLKEFYKSHVDLQDKNLKSAKKLAVLVPFQGIFFQHLSYFVPGIHKYLTDKGILHEIFLLNQIGPYR